MNRVDYLISRVGQLRHRGASPLWAQWLTRLELGERPTGQQPSPKIDPRRLFQILRRDLADQAPVAWRASAPMDEWQGRVLALLLRAVTSAKDYRERTYTDGVSVLTLSNLDAVAPAFSLMISWPKDRLPKTREFEYWLMRHVEEFPPARVALLALVDQPGRAGFASYDG